MRAAELYIRLASEQLYLYLSRNGSSETAFINSILNPIPLYWILPLEMEFELNFDSANEKEKDV